MFYTILWAGVALAAIGMALLFWCIIIVWRAKRAGLEGDAMQAKLRGVVTLNLGAMALAGLGLMMVLVGAILG